MMDSETLIETLSDLLDEGEYKAAADFDFKVLDVPAIAWAYRGFANWKIENFRQARDDFSRAIEQRATAQNTLFLRGRCSEELEEFHSAIEDYERVLELASSTPDAHAHLGFCLEQLGHENRARASYLQALQLDPNEALALAGLKALSE